MSMGLNVMLFPDKVWQKVSVWFIKSVTKLLAPFVLLIMIRFTFQNLDVSHFQCNLKLIIHKTI